MLKYPEPRRTGPESTIPSSSNLSSAGSVSSFTSGNVGANDSEAGAGPSNTNEGTPHLGVAKGFRDTLISYEQLDQRSSPDLWPEMVPGLSNFTERTLLPGTPTLDDPDAAAGRERTSLDLEEDDLDLMKELSTTSADKLMSYVTSLQNVAYQYGVEEANQLKRGKILKILEKSEQDPQQSGNDLYWNPA